MTQTPTSVSPMIQLFAHVEELAILNHRFFAKQEISPVAYGDARGAALGRALNALAQHFSVQLEAPLSIDSRGEFSIVVDRNAKGGPVNSFNQNKVYGAGFVEVLNAFEPRCGISPPAILQPEGCWCHMNHFSVEKMVFFAAERFKREILAEEPLRAGRQVITLLGEIDTDEDGQERTTPPGATGVLVESSDPFQWAVSFGDAGVHIAESDLFDASKYRIIDLGLAEKKLVLEDAGYTITEDRDQPGLWVWYAPSDGCDVSFSDEDSAIKAAWSDAVRQAKSILTLEDREWAELPLDEKLGAIKRALVEDSPQVER